MNNETLLLEIYSKLIKEFGHQNWWPADNSFEVIIGAILTQNISWKNASKAIDNLKKMNILSPDGLNELNIEDLAGLIKSSRFYNLKAKRIKIFLKVLFDEYNADLSLMAKENPMEMREKLLNLKGFGEETVDSILLYSFNMPFFVIDNYTKRILSRYGLIQYNLGYSDFQDYFQKSLPMNLDVYQDFHAQFVILGANICKRNPECTRCPIRKMNGNIYCNYFKFGH